MQTVTLHSSSQRGGEAEVVTKNGSRMRIVPFRARHLDGLRLQDAQSGMAPLLNREVGASLEAAGPAFSALYVKEVIACAGVMEVWSGRLQAWALLSPCGPERFLRVHRAVAHFLVQQKARRIETAVDCAFEAGHRWARLLGFRMEAPVMLRFGPDGRDAALYARVRADGEQGDGKEGADEGESSAGGIQRGAVV